jgi:hypothetical protein
LDLFPWEMNPDKASQFHYKEWMEQRLLLENLESCLQQVSQMSEEEIKEKRRKDPWLDKYLKYADTVIANASTLPFITLSNASKDTKGSLFLLLFVIQWNPISLFFSFSSK